MARSWFIAASVLLLALPLGAQQQDNSSQQNPPDAPVPQQQNPPAPQKKSQQPPKNGPTKSTADQNPFPEAQSEAAAHQAQQPDPPQPQTGPASKPGSSDENPFPEAQSEKAAHATPQPDKHALPPAPPGSSSDDNFSSSHVQGLDMPTTDETPPANLPPSTLPWNPKLAKKDSSVGDFYMESGDWKGAYDRFLEANRSDPGNAEAVFGLAESARHLGHQQEALRNYRLYLIALPNGPHAKEVRKALKEMGAAPPA